MATPGVSIEGVNIKKTIRIGGFSELGNNQDDLRHILDASCGEVTKLKILGDHPDHLFAIVEFATQEAVEKAMELHNLRKDGLHFTVEMASVGINSKDEIVDSRLLQDGDMSQDAMSTDSFQHHRDTSTSSARSMRSQSDGVRCMIHMSGISSTAFDEAKLRRLIEEGTGIPIEYVHMLGDDRQPVRFAKVCIQGTSRTQQLLRAPLNNALVDGHQLQLSYDDTEGEHAVYTATTFTGRTDQNGGNDAVIKHCTFDAAAGRGIKISNIDSSVPQEIVLNFILTHVGQFNHYQFLIAEGSSVMKLLIELKSKDCIPRARAVGGKFLGVFKLHVSEWRMDRDVASQASVSDQFPALLEMDKLMKYKKNRSQYRRTYRLRNRRGGGRMYN